MTKPKRVHYIEKNQYADWFITEVDLLVRFPSGACKIDTCPEPITVSPHFIFDTREDAIRFVLGRFDDKKEYLKHNLRFLEMRRQDFLERYKDVTNETKV